MYKTGYTLHLGIHASKNIAKILMNSLKQASRDTEDKMDLRVVVDGDSFLEWGEKIRWDTDPHPLHVTVTFQDSFAPTMVLLTWIGMEQVIEKLKCHMTDYIVVTDNDDWSEDAQVIVAEDIIKIGHQILRNVDDEDVRFNWYKAVPWKP